MLMSLLWNNLKYFHYFGLVITLDHIFSSWKVLNACIILFTYLCHKEVPCIDVFGSFVAI